MINIVKMDRGTGKTTAIRNKALSDMRDLNETGILPIVLVSDYRHRKHFLNSEVIESGLSAYVHIRPKTKEDLYFFMKLILDGGSYYGIESFKIYIDDALKGFTALNALEYYSYFDNLPSKHPFILELYTTSN